MCNFPESQISLRSWLAIIKDSRRCTKDGSKYIDLKTPSRTSIPTKSSGGIRTRLYGFLTTTLLSELFFLPHGAPVYVHQKTSPNCKESWKVAASLSKTRKASVNKS